jgi:uroporphyrinogen-III synthase
MRLLVTRPEMDATVLQARLAERGHTVTVEPLITISHEGAEIPDLDGAQALIATSRNGLRALTRLTGDKAAEVDAAKFLPLFVVGPGTAASAAALGFQNIIKGPATARELVAVIEDHAEVNGGPLVHLAGDTLIYDFASDLQRLGFFVTAPVVYTTIVADRFQSPSVASMRNGRFDGVLLLSPRTTQVYCQLVEHHNLIPAACKLHYFCLSAAVAAPLAGLRKGGGTGEGAPRISVASAPNLQQLLALIPPSAA